MSQTKELKINDILFANYELEEDLLYLKVNRNINGEELNPDTVGEWEYIIASLISLVEKVEINKLAYLNI